MLLGDFNDKCTDWILPHAHSEIGNKLSNLLTQNNLYQIINEPTRYFSNEPALLDLIIIDCPHLVLRSGVSPPLANQDHCTIQCEFNIKTYRTKSFKRIVWDYKSADVKALNEALDAAPWGVPLTLYEDLDDVHNFNNSIILSTCKEHIISKNVTIHTKDKPWMCNEVRYFIRKRDRCFKRFKKTLSAQDQLNFYIARKEANRAKRNAKNSFNQRL